ncbi:MAG: hypothetical protein IID33_12080 [Planctomycetes bacterium]|nr:hypothetical protein [Planctomycetota bacterium]
MCPSAAEHPLARRRTAVSPPAIGIPRTCYNSVRPHWTLVPESGGDPVTPEEVYTIRVKPKFPRWQGWAKAAREKLDELMQLPA